MIHLILKNIYLKAILLIVFSSSFSLVYCKTPEVQTKWSSTPVKVDGKMDDWANVPMLYFEDPGVQLGLRNDSVNFYILFRFNNEAWAQAIRMGGLTIWFDVSGKKKKDTGIRYTGGPSFLDFQKMKTSNEGGFEESMTEEQKQKLAEREKNMVMADQIVAIGKKGVQVRKLAIDGSDGPAVSFDSSQGKGACTYEISLPLQTSDISHYGIGAQLGQTVGLGLEWGGVTMPDRKSDKGGRPGGMGGGPPGGGPGGAPPGGMGGGPPGGMGGGPPGGSSNNKSSEKQELWITTKLALPSTQ